MRGRKPKSDEEKRLTGNPGKRAKKKAPAAAPEVKTHALSARNVFDPPEDLNGVGRLKWKQFIPHLLELNLLSRTDFETLKMLCRACERYEQAAAVVARDGFTYTVESKHGTRIAMRPEVGIMERADKRILEYMRELCMTSVTRVRTLATGLQSNQLKLPFAEDAPKQAASANVLANENPIGFLRPVHTGGNC